MALSPRPLLTVAPRALRLDRPTFRQVKSFPLTYHDHSLPQHQLPYPTERVESNDSMPDDWLAFVASSSPHPKNTSDADDHAEFETSNIDIQPAAGLLGPLPRCNPTDTTAMSGSANEQEVEVVLQDRRPLRCLSPGSRRRVEAENALMLGVAHASDDDQACVNHGNDHRKRYEHEEKYEAEGLYELAMASAAIDTDVVFPQDTSHSPHPPSVDWETDGCFASSTFSPVPIHRIVQPPLAPQSSPCPSSPPASATDAQVPTPATGTSSSDSPEKFDTPIDVRIKRRKAAERARMNALTPTRLSRHAISGLRMLGEPEAEPVAAPVSAVSASTKSKRSFAILDDIEEDKGCEEEEDLQNVRRRLFSPQLAEQWAVNREEQKKEERNAWEASVATQPKPEEHSSQCEDDGKSEGGELETPSKESEYKHSDHPSDDEESDDDDDLYDPRQSAKVKRRSKRKARQSHPYGTRRRNIPPTPLTPAHQSKGSPSQCEYEDDEGCEEEQDRLRGVEKTHAKVEEFKAYLAAPKRLREPRFDLKIFHWTMSDQPEMRWSKGGQGVEIPNVQKFYTNVLHREAREKKEQKGKKSSKRDLPGKSAFERQLSMYGFTRSTHGKAMLIDRPDLRQYDNAKLLNKVKKVWAEMQVAIRAPRAKSETVSGVTYYRQQHDLLRREVEKKDKELEEKRHQLVEIQAFARELVQLVPPTALMDSKPPPFFDITSLISNGVKAPPSDDQNGSLGTSAAREDTFGQATPLKSIADIDIEMPVEEAVKPTPKPMPKPTQRSKPKPKPMPRTKTKPKSRQIARRAMQQARR